MPAKRQRAKDVSPFIGFGGQLSDKLLIGLADRLDPPVVVSELVWQEPPDIVDWGHSNFVDPVLKSLIKLADYQQRLLRKICQMIWAGHLTTVVWSEPKKSGKTTTAGLFGSYWANYIEQPNEIISIANDQEQAQGRIYAAMAPTMERLGWNVPERMPLMENRQTGSIVKAIGTSYEGEAGGNYGLTLWSELWAYSSERRKRLWEEMTPVPTRRFSVRWVETYAGFLGESDLLWKLYCQAFRNGKEDEPLGQKVDDLEDLPVWYLADSKLIVFWSHEPRQVWQTPTYYAQQRSDLRPTAYRRLHGNEWVSSESVFISPAQWDVLTECEELNEGGDTRQIVLGADASISNDSTALVAAAWDDDAQAPCIVGAWEWRPTESEAHGHSIVDLSETLKKKLIYLLGNYTVRGIYYDAYQLHAVMTDLQKTYDRNGIKKLFVDFPQSSGRVESDQAFYQWIVAQTLQRIRHPRLREHVLNAVARETDRGFRLDKEKTTMKIDLAVCSSMACYGASVKTKPKRKFLSLANAGKNGHEEAVAIP